MPTLEPLECLTSTATPLPIDSIDTDVITPVHRIMEGSFVEHAFETLRRDADGNRRPNPFDDPAHAGDQILVTGANFGCGSSRETAVWAVKGMGYRVVIAESFGDIFHANCFKNAVLPVVLRRDEVALLLDAARARDPIRVDVAAATVSTGAHSFTFDLPELRRTALLEGLDDLDLALRMDAEIDAFESAHQARQPWLRLPA